MPRSLVQAHRLLAAALAAFILVHLLVHLGALGGEGLHRRLLGAVQVAYRNPVVEPLLVLAILAQIAIGARLLMRRWAQDGKGFWGWTQIISGIVLALFLVLHTTAALVTRHVMGLDTDFSWVAATLQIAPFKFFFFPYYGTAVLSVFAHLAAAIRFGWERRGNAIPGLLLAVGASFSGLILAAFGGVLYPITLPPDNAAYFDRMGF